MIKRIWCWLFHFKYWEREKSDWQGELWTQYDNRCTKCGELFYD